MQKRISIGFLFSIIGSQLLFSCKHDVNIPDAPAISFQTDIKPILTGNCNQITCHGTNGAEDPLVTYDEVIENGDVKPGNANDSKIYQAVKWGMGEDNMPPAPGTQLTDRQLKLIYIWIEQGALNN